MKAINMQDINKMHFKEFGVNPVITGIEFWNEIPLEERVLKAISDGIPYIEDQMQDGELT